MDQLNFEIHTAIISTLFLRYKFEVNINSEVCK